MNYLVRGVAALAVAWVLSWSRPVEACGCFAPPSAAEPIVQAGERILFSVNNGKVTAHIQIQYAGDAKDFGWLLPLPSVPTLKLGSDELFTRLGATTQPTLHRAERPGHPVPAGRQWLRVRLRFAPSGHRSHRQLRVARRGHLHAAGDHIVDRPLRLRSAPGRRQGGDAPVAVGQPLLRPRGHRTARGPVHPPRRLLPRAQAQVRRGHR